ncbi:MAG: nitrilase-related carbon-nitrogen hydrolase [Thermodesulfobacteriota bacterium]
MEKKQLKLAVVQFSPEFDQKQKNLDRIARLTEGLAADIIVLPELCTTGYFFLSREEAARAAEPADGPTARFFQDMAESRNAVVAAGFAERDGDRLFNACLIARPQAPARIYRKTHLFYKEKFCFDPGDRGFFVIEDTTRDLRLGPMICYDFRFPEAARILALQGADVIVCPSNLVTDLWHPVMVARAVENKVYIAVANRAGRENRSGEELAFTGRSAIFGFNGRELKTAAAEGDEILEAAVIPAKTRDKAINPLNDLIKDRQPGHYGPLAV